MLKILNRVLLIAALPVVALSPAIAGETFVTSGQKQLIEEEEASWWTASLSAAWDSKYIFRGVNITPGSSLVSTTLELGAYGFTAGIWFAEAVSEDYNELNAYLDYTRTVGPVDLSAGYIYYLLPKLGDIDTHELYAGITFTECPYVTPSLYYYHDVDLVDGGYLEFKLESSIPLYRDVVSLNPYVLISAGDYNHPSWNWNNVQTGLVLEIALSENITVSGYGAHTHALDAIHARFRGTGRNEFWGGASIAFAF